MTPREPEAPVGDSYFYVVLVHLSWTRLEVKTNLALPGARTKTNEMPGCGFLPVFKTYQEAKAWRDDQGITCDIQVIKPKKRETQHDS